MGTQSTYTALLGFRYIFSTWQPLWVLSLYGELNNSIQILIPSSGHETVHECIYFLHYHSTFSLYFLLLLSSQHLLKGHSRLKRILSKERLLDSFALLGLETIGEKPADPDQPDAQPLLIQAKIQSVYVDVDCRDENGSTPLILAALNGHRDVVYTLLQYSANVQLKDPQGWVMVISTIGSDYCDVHCYLTTILAIIME